MAVLMGRLFQEVYERYHINYEPLVRKYTLNKSEEEKAEEWLAVIEAFATFDPTKGTLPGYVASKVKYAVWNISKKNSRIWRSESLVGGNTELIESLADITDVSELTEKQFTCQELQKALNGLTDRQWQTIIKTVIYGYSLRDIALEMGITPQAVFNLRKRGLSRLKMMVK